MPANRVPNVESPLQDSTGRTNPLWWRFWARISAQFTAVDAPLPGLLLWELPLAIAADPAPDVSRLEDHDVALALADPPPAFNPQDVLLAALLADAPAGNPAPQEFADVAPAAFDSQDVLLAALLADRADAPAAAPVTRDVLANIPGGFNAGDAGRLFYATDYCHVYRWTGAAWEFLEGDGSGQVVIGQPSGAPNGGLWGLCDGTAYLVAQANGTTASVTTQNLGGGAFIMCDTVAAQQAATPPTLSTIVGVVVNPNVTGVTLGNDTDAGITINNPASGGTPVAVALKPHTHALTDPGHAHTTTVTQPVINAPSQANGGLPLRVGVQFYIRR